MHSFGENPLPLELGAVGTEEEAKLNEPILEEEQMVQAKEDCRKSKVVPPTHDEVLWAWKVREL